VALVTDDLVPLLDRPEAAAALHVSERTVRRYGKSGLLDERRIGPRLIRITQESVKALIALQGQASHAPADQVAA
jgi:hypothetical protein